MLPSSFPISAGSDCCDQPCFKHVSPDPDCVLRGLMAGLCGRKDTHHREVKGVGSAPSTPGLEGVGKLTVGIREITASLRNGSAPILSQVPMLSNLGGFRTETPPCPSALFWLRA